MKLKFSLVSFIALGSLKGLLGSDSVVPLEDIIWVVGTNNQSQSQACIGNGHLPFYMGDYPMEWNADSMENIVVNVLGKTVSSDSTSGISGCCAPGLWCIGDECFTQGFGSSFANFGWLSSNYSAKPVYTCYGWADNTTVSLSSEKLSDGYLTVSGSGFGQVAPDLTITVDSQYCSDPEICTCSTCTAKSDCYTGQDCIISSREDESGLCLTSCAGVDDTSCPCDYSCGLLASDSGTFYACIPSDFYKSSTACNVHEMLMCSIPNIYQSAYAPLSSDVVSIALTSSTGGLSSAGPTGSNTDFCSSDADCSDGNLCTLDTCNTDSGLCEYSSAGEECGSILPTIRSRYAPYMYLDTLFTNRSALQAEFNSFMVSHGDSSSVTNVAGLDDYTDVVDLSFSAVFFGNLVTQVGITPYGSLSVQPQQPCNTDNNCPLFTTISNAIAMWYSNGWSTGTADGRSILRYAQDSNDTSVEVYGISAVNALHVLYQNVSLDDGLNTFGASLYEDGSIRVSYQLVNDSSLNSTISKDEFFGLWGQYAYKGPTRYHQETLDTDVITSGVDVVYCPLSALACVPQSCVAAGQSLVALWNGTDTCTALGPSAQLTLTCSWSGGLTTTAATFDSETGSVSCDVPTLAFPDGSLLFVDVVVSVSTSVPINTAAASSALPGSNSIYMVTSRGQEISRSNLQVRYYSSSNSSESGYAQCGCSALINTNLTCSDSLVCNGQSNDYSDCAGTPFGAAFEDCGGNCMYGMSGVYEETEYCQDDDSGGGGSEFLDLVSQTIILLIIICCMTFVTSTISYSVRRMLIRRRQEEMQEFEFEADLYMVRNGGGVGGRDGANRRGLSEFECDALGTIIFTPEFYKEHKKKQLELMHGIDATPAAAGEGTSAAPASGMGGCDCPICLMDIMEGNVVRALPDPCGHVFHVACIDQWFKQSHVCPLCKRSMRAILEGEEESTSDSDLNPAGNSTTRYASRTAQSGANYDAASRSLATLDRLISRLNSYTANSGGGGGGSGGAGSSGADNNNSSSNSDPESGIALTRVPSSNRHAGSDGPVVERSARHFDL